MEEDVGCLGLAGVVGEIGRGDVVVVATWTGRDKDGRPLRMPLPASRWIGEISLFSPEFEAMVA